MPGRKVIFWSLLALLFLFGNSNASQAYVVRPAASVVASTANYVVKIVPVSAFSFSRRAITKDYIKVRYMGGQCSFNILPAIVHYSIREYIDSPYPAPGRFFISYRDRLVFKLRGPPRA